MPQSATDLLRRCETALQEAHGLRKIAVVRDRAAYDIACLAPGGLTVVVRCVVRATPRDHAAIATMISEGDFIWGAVVYDQTEEPNSLSLIETFHIGQLDKLLGRLKELREACSEAS